MSVCRATVAVIVNAALGEPSAGEADRASGVEAEARDCRVRRAEGEHGAAAGRLRDGVLALSTDLLGLDPWIDSRLNGSRCRDSADYDGEDRERRPNSRSPDVFAEWISHTSVFSFDVFSSDSRRARTLWTALGRR